MNAIARNFTPVVLVVAAAIAVPAPARAEPQDGRVLVWMAASSSEPTVASQWGRLSMKDGVLAFAATGLEWQVAVTDIRNVAVSDESDKFIVIETTRDEKYYVAILGPNMMIENPRKALDMIRRAQRVVAGRR